MTPSWLRRSILAAILLIAGVAEAWAIDYIVPEAGLRFPKWLGRFVMDEGTQASRGEQGHMLRYTRGGFIGSVYVYDGGRGKIPDGVRNPVVQAELERARNDVLSVARMRRLPAPVRTADAVDRDAGIEFLSTTYRLDDLRTQRDSVVAITGLRGHFIKLRMTAPPGADGSDFGTFRAHLATLLTGGTVPAQPPPAPPPPAVRVTDLSLPDALGGYRRVAGSSPLGMMATDTLEASYRKGSISVAKVSFYRRTGISSADGIQAPAIRAEVDDHHIEMMQAAAHGIASGLPYTTVAPHSPNPVSFGAYGGPTWPFLRAIVALRGGGVWESEMAVYLTSWRGYFLRVDALHYAHDGDDLRVFMSALVRALPR